ncbi:MAG: hypothetical protein IKC70_08395 [Bacteroidaceae bacterium]|nr:hypothetical protein [Bacteroidaceae bacterium]
MIVIVYNIASVRYNKYHEITERLNIPIGTVKSRIHTARMRLQLLLKNYAE